MAKKRSAETKGVDVKAFLGEGAEFSGVLTFEGTVRIDGKFQGDVMTRGTLVVGEEAVLNADISAGTVVIKGRVRGNITASKRLELLSGGRLKGDVRTPVLVVEEGAVFDGALEMTPREADAVQQVDTHGVERITL
jgi:cytoskeletal protein CcmA (bactofilin family)